MNTSGSFSAQNFARLSDQVKKDLAAKTDWDATYSGCDLDVYLHPFSYEPLSGYPGEARSADQLRSAMGVKPETSPPTGAAIVASRLVLYAALLKARAIAPAGAPPADQAVALAKRILLAWANRGFRDQKGNLRGTSITSLRTVWDYKSEEASSIPFTPKIFCSRLGRSMQRRRASSINFTPSCSI